MPQKKKKSRKKNAVGDKKPPENFFWFRILITISGTILFLVFLFELQSKRRAPERNAQPAINFEKESQLEIIKRRCINRIEESNIEVSKSLEGKILAIDLPVAESQYPNLANRIINLVMDDWLNRNAITNINEMDSRIKSVKHEIETIDFSVNALREKIPTIENSIKMLENNREKYSNLDPSLPGKYKNLINTKESELISIKAQLNAKESELNSLKKKASDLAKEKNRLKFMELTFIYEINDDFDYELWSYDEYSIATRQKKSDFISALQKGSTNYYGVSAYTVESFDRNFTE